MILTESHRLGIKQFLGHALRARIVIRVNVRKEL